MKSKDDVYSSIIIFIVSILLVGYSVYGLISLGIEAFFPRKNVIVLQPNKELEIKADISGAVNRPGVYIITQNMRLIDLVEKAAGFDSSMVDYEAVYKNLNLSQLIYNEDKFFIPYKKELTQETTSDSSDNESKAENNEGKININSASIAELGTLPGVGDAIAQRIVDARPYKTIDDLKNVKGIGDSTFDKLKDLIKVN